MYNIIANQNICLQGARSIGAVVVNMGAEDLMNGNVSFMAALLIMIAISCLWTTLADH